MMNVTAVIPVFNRAASIGFAIDSVLAQQVPAGCALTVVVADDGSTDDLAGTLRRYGDRVTLLRHATNAGPAAARNTGVSAAGLGYVAFLDSDDIWLPGKLMTQIETMQRNGWVASCTAYYLVRNDGTEFVAPRYGTRALTIEDAVWGCFTGPGSTLLCERSVFDAVGLLDARLRRLEDWEWQLRFHRHQSALGFINEPLARVAHSDHRNAENVMAALDVIRSVHGDGLSGALRRHFTAATCVEAAAAHYRAGRTIFCLHQRDEGAHAFAVPQRFPGDGALQPSRRKPQSAAGR